MYGVGAISPSDVWAVGDYVKSNQGNLVTHPLAEHWNGSSWTTIPVPSQGTSSNTLLAVGGTSSTDVWALGVYAVPQFTLGYVLAEHWNGSQWTILPAPNTGRENTLTGVAAVSSHDVWAVGFATSDGVNDSQLIEHWDGSNWSLTAVPSYGSGSESRLRSVIALAANDVWAVGTMQPANSNPSNTPWTALIEHWNGSAWSVVPSAATDVELWGVVASGANSIWAVGNGFDTTAGRRVTATMHWNGAQWSVVRSPSTPYGENILKGVTMTSDGLLTAVGYGGTVNTSQVGIAERWTGQAWAMQQLPSLPSEASPGWAPTWQFTGIAAAGASVWAVGFDLPSQAPNSGAYQTLVERY